MIQKEQIDAYDKRFPAEDFKKLSFDFNEEESRELLEWDALLKIGQTAELMVNQILNNVFLPRLSIPGSPNVGILFDVITRKALVYVPRVWCTKCLKRKAEYEVQGKVYCAGCTEIIKQEFAKKIEENKALVKEVPKVKPTKKKV